MHLSLAPSSILIVLCPWNDNSARFVMSLCGQLWLKKRRLHCSHQTADWPVHKSPTLTLWGIFLGDWFWLWTGAALTLRPKRLAPARSSLPK